MANDPFAEFGGTATLSGENLSPEEQAKRDYEDAIGSGTLSVSAVKPGNTPPPEGDPFGAFGGKLLGTQPSDAIPRTETTAGGLAGAALRGAAPTIAGAGVGAVIGGGIGAIGGPLAIPGAIIGARVGGAVAPILGDLGVGAINSIFQTHYTQPTEAIQHFLTSIGVPEAATEAERIVQASSGAVAGTAATMGLGGAMAGAGNQTVRRIGQFLAANPEQQIASAATGGAAGQGVQEMGGGTGAQIAANVLTGMGTVKLMGSTLVNTAENAARQQLVREGDAVGIQVKTSDVFPSEPGFLRRSAEGMPFIGMKGPNQAIVKQRAQAVANLLAEHGVSPSLVSQDQELTRLYNSFAIERGKQLRSATDLKQEALATAAAKNLPVNVTNTINSIDNYITSLQSRAIGSKIIPELQNYRNKILGGNLDAIENARADLGLAFDATGLEGIKPAATKIINSLYKPLRKEITDHLELHGAPGDVRRYEVASRRIKILADDLNETTLRSVLATGDRTPENIRKLIFSGQSSKIAQLYNSLPEIGKSQFRTAVIREAAQKSLVDGIVNERLFSSNIRDLERQLHIGFSPDQRQAVEGLGRVLERTQGAEKQLSRMPAMVGATTVGIVSHFLHAGWFAQFTTAAGITASASSIARIYETAPVRNALIQLARVQPNTVGYDTALRSAMEAFNSEITKETKKQEKKK
jgi:hypothetical protein